MDNTYGTNLYKMPLFQVTVITNVSSIANIGFGIVDNEREEAFYWLVQQLDGIRHRLRIPAPDVVITDFEKALKNALLSSPQMAWHQPATVPLPRQQERGLEYQAQVRGRRWTTHRQP